MQLWIFLSCLLIFFSAFFSKISPTISKVWEYFLYGSIFQCCSPEQHIGELFQQDVGKELAFEKERIKERGAAFFPPQLEKKNQYEFHYEVFKPKRICSPNITRMAWLVT